MDEARVGNMPYQDQRPLQASDLPEGYGATGRLVPTGVRWTFIEVLRSRYLLILLMALCISVLMLFVLTLLLYGGKGISGLIVYILSHLVDIVFLAEYESAQIALIYIVLFAPLVLLFGLPCAFVLKLVYNRRERRTVPIPRAQEVHAYDARFKWNAVFAAIAGILCFIILDMGVFLLYCIALMVLEELGVLAEGYWGSDTTRLLLSYVALMLAELPSRQLAGLGAQNALLVERLAFGAYDAWLPWRLRTPEGRALVSSLLGAGTAHTVRGAVLLTRVLDVCAAVRDVSEVMGGLFEALISVVTVGAFAQVVGAAEDARAACAENAARDISFGEPGFIWPQSDTSDSRRRNRRTIVFASALFVMTVVLQLLVCLAM